MERDVQLFIRQHGDDSFTVSSLTHPAYAAYGRELRNAIEELDRVLAGELALGTIARSDPMRLEGLKQRSIEVEIRAVQHGRLLRMPMRVTLLIRELTEQAGRFEVLLPRLNERFEIRGEANIEPWAEEVVRGRFHLVDVDSVRRFEHDRGERFEEHRVRYRPIDGKRLERERGPQSDELKPQKDDAEEDAFEDASVFDGLGQDWVKLARAGSLPRAYRRERSVEQLEVALASGSSVLLLGPSGVGKTATVQELCHRIASASAGALEDRAVWHVTAGRLMSGMIYLGEWQERALELVAAARGAGAILYLDRLLEWASATSGANESGMSLGRLLAPFVADKQVLLIFEATEGALNQAEMMEASLTQELRRLPVPVLDAGDAYDVLGRLASSLGRKHRMRFSDEALQAALDVIARFGDADGLPGSALSLLEQIARDAAGGAAPVLADRALEAFCLQTGFPRPLVDPRAALALEEVESFFAERVVGQPEAVGHLVDVVALLKAGMNDPGRPVASFLFLGPTGVGKTESALCLAEYLFGQRDRVVRLDMSEYGYRGAAMRLIDGRDGEGDLTRPLRRQPFCVLLLDEIEKASAEVFDLLLSVLGEGRLTDATGRSVSFRHAIVILTSNLGAARKPPIGLDRSERKGADALGAARQFFRPELFNRIDRSILFNPLDRSTSRSIAKLLLRAALDREGLKRRGLRVELDETLIDQIAERGYDPALGARPMKRTIDALVLVPLSEHLASAKLRDATIRLSMIDGQLVFGP